MGDNRRIVTFQDTSHFWARVARVGDCDEWQGGMMPNGYGACWYVDTAGQRQRTSAHRVSWMLEHGEVPSGLLVCHRCDNRRCVRPSHLFLGTPKDNMQDMTAKGRSARQVLLPSDRAEIAHRYERCYRKVRHRTGAKWRSNAPELALEFGVSEHTIRRSVELHSQIGRQCPQCCAVAGYRHIPTTAVILRRDVMMGATA